jgi:glycosyltransferase involved in cell wall biosynthesis
VRILTWQWGRRGASPRFAAALAEGFSQLEEVESLLSLAAGAELLRGRGAPRCDLPMPTYESAAGLVGRVVRAPGTLRWLVRRLRALRVDAAVCAQPALLDPLMQAALWRLRIPYAVIVHDGTTHPGDWLSFLLVGYLQRRVIGGAHTVMALSGHVAEILRRQGVSPMIGWHPPYVFGPPPPPPGAHGGVLRLLCFGRLLPYKGLDLLATAMRLPHPPAELRVVGQGPESDELRALRALPGVTVENRWVPEDEIAALLGWADAVVLPYREASQSGVAAAALASGRFVVATRVGGLAEQLGGMPAVILCEPTGESVAAAIAELPLLDPALERAAEMRGWRELAGVLRDALVT